METDVQLLSRFIKEELAEINDAEQRRVAYQTWINAMQKLNAVKIDRINNSLNIPQEVKR